MFENTLNEHAQVYLTCELQCIWGIFVQSVAVNLEETALTGCWIVTCNVTVKNIVLKRKILLAVKNHHDVFLT